MVNSILKQAMAGDLVHQRELCERYRLGRDPASACAWRIVIVASGAAGVTPDDIEHRKRDCEGLAVAQQRAATARAKALFQEIYGRDLELPADLFGGNRRAGS